MPKYRVLAESFIDNHRRMPGAEIEFAGLPSDNLEPVDDEGKARAAEAKAVRRQGLEQMVADFKPVAGVDPAAFASAVAKAVADAIRPALAVDEVPKDEKPKGGKKDAAGG